MVFRVVKNGNYTVMSNFHFKDKTLSLKAKGLLSLMLSLPDDWDYSIAGLVSLSCDGETAVRSAIKELEKHNYLKRERVYENGRIVDWNYVVFEQPDILSDEDLVVENQQVGFQLQGFNGQLNTNKSNTKEINKLFSKENNATEEPEFEFGKDIEPKKPKRKTNLDEFEDAKLLIRNYTNNCTLIQQLMTLANTKYEICSKERRHFYSTTIKNYLEELTRTFDNDDNQKIEAVKLSIRYNGTTKVMKPNIVKTGNVKDNIERIGPNDYDKYDRTLSEREF